MGKENWGEHGMPPIMVEVLHREILADNNSSYKEKVYIKGHKIHLGVLHQGWQGEETIVMRERRNGKVRLIKDDLLLRLSLVGSRQKT